MQDYRKKGEVVLRAQWRALLSDGVSAGAVQRLRRVLELDERGDRSRATRVRLSWELSQMRLLPTKEQLRRERRLAIDAPDRVARFLLTRTALREILRWDYLVASSTAGIRRYRTAAGEEKRLRAHTNHYWDAKAGLRDDDDLSADEDDGVFVSNLNAEYDGCYTPRETDPARIDELLRQSWSYLEDNDGGRALQVLAVGSSCLAVPPLSLCGHGQPTFLCYGGRSP